TAYHQYFALYNFPTRRSSDLTELDPKFSFNKISFEIYKLLEEKAVTASTIRNFYLRRTTPRKKTIEAIQRWIDEEKKENVNHSEDRKSTRMNSSHVAISYAVF